MLDRNRYYAIVYGDDERKYMQDGMFYNGVGEPVDKASTAQQAAPEPAPQKVEKKEAAGPSEKLERLQAMHISKLKTIASNLAEQLGQEPPVMSGQGVKAKLVAYIAENTE